ncbi:uncharacterized protein LOC119365048 isoform X2 [Triticum dicoccoides]|uniref:uncharacterized protein LOC119365048 isoform X2 n=1 Tax=Triticum dicoccoides TaxID=85692 RepID=UPI0018907B50|nr:uncharacterized protein LOC119365048 isoform X2 [Triticum dicoccoides]
MPSTPLANGTVRVRPSTISFLAHLLPIAKPGSPRPPQLLAREEKRRWQPLPPFSCGRAAPLLRPRLPGGRSRRSCCCRSSARRGSGGPRCARRRRPLIGGSRRTLSDDLLGMPPLLSKKDCLEGNEAYQTRKLWRGGTFLHPWQYRGVAHASHLVAVTDRQEQGWGCIKEESGAVGEGLLLGGPWGSKVRWVSLLEPYDQKDDRKGSFQAYKHKVDCWSLMESGSCSKICDILWKLQVGQAVHEDPTTTTKVYKQQYNNSRNLHLNTALFSRIIISRLESTSPHNLQSSTIMFCFMFYDQQSFCYCQCFHSSRYLSMHILMNRHKTLDSHKYVR